VAVGDTVRVRVLHVDMKEHRLALGMKQLTTSPWHGLLEAHPVGSTITGPVRSLTDFGIFVRVDDGIDGLVHVTDFSWTERIKHPSERYKKGDEVTAVVLDVDVDKERLALGIKQLTEDPWVLLARRLPAGTKVPGKVVRIVDFGAFIEIEPGIEGLCHISALSTERVERVSDVLKEGDTPDVTIVKIDTRDRKISLSLKPTNEDAGDYRAYLEETPEKQKSFSNSFGDKLAKKLGEGR
jgi:small subunit ribosomal protein S1